MSGVRPFRREDIPAVVSLRPQAFRSSRQGSPDALAGYFERIFFESPWRDESLPSLVYADGQGRPRGFLGVVPRRMRLGDRDVRVAVPTQFMVHPDNRGIAGVELMRRFLHGPQDLALSDRGNDTARRVWERLGGSTALVFSLFWSKPLRPARFGLVRRSHSRLVEQAIAATGPLWGAVDLAVAALSEPAVPRDAPPGRVEAIDPVAAVALVHDFLPRGTLEPVYDASVVRWLVAELSAKTKLGDLQSLLVRDAEGAPAGWCLYYVNPRGVSQVVTIAARPERAGDVIGHLAHRAAGQGATAVIGRMEPLLLADLGEARCRFDRNGPWMLVHARDPDVLAAVLGGRAFVSRLDSEWWLNF